MDGSLNRNIASHILQSMDDPQPLRNKFSPNSENQREVNPVEQQMILEAAFTAVCDNIMSNQMHGNTDIWI